MKRRNVPYYLMMIVSILLAIGSVKLGFTKNNDAFFVLTAIGIMIFLLFLSGLVESNKRKD